MSCFGRGGFCWFEVLSMMTEDLNRPLHSNREGLNGNCNWPKIGRKMCGVEQIEHDMSNNRRSNDPSSDH